MAAEQEHGGRWSGLGPEPLTDAEWRAHLREASDGEIEELCDCDFVRERHDAQNERDRRKDEGTRACTDEAARPMPQRRCE